jgi:hypothetical protein
LYRCVGYLSFLASLTFLQIHGLIPIGGSRWSNVIFYIECVLNFEF